MELQPPQTSSPEGTIPEAHSLPSRFGSHFLNLWRACPMKWYRQYLMPHPDGGNGLEPRTTHSALFMGSAVHEGLAVYYATGAKDGKYDLDRAVSEIETRMAQRRDELSGEDYSTIVAEAVQMLRRYHDWYGPGGVMPDYPNLQIVSDDLGPVLEREYAIDLGGGYTFTARIDGLCKFNGYTNILEHKTVRAAGLTRLFNEMGTNLQATGQMFVLKSAYPDLNVGGVLVNALVKDRAVRSGKPPFDRTLVSRTSFELAKFHNDALLTLRQIEDARGEWKRLLDEGLTPDEASRRVFVMNTQECVRFRACDYFGICKALGYESRGLGNYRVRTKPADTQPEENES